MPRTKTTAEKRRNKRSKKKSPSTSSASSKKIIKQVEVPLTLTGAELIHLRDIFSIIIAPGVSATKSLATAENRLGVDESLWQKVAEACEGIGLATGGSAPDFITVISMDVVVERAAPNHEEMPDGDAADPTSQNHLFTGWAARKGKQ